MRITAHRLVVLCLLGLCGPSMAATLYRWVDAQGVVHYSDTPQPGAQVVHIQGAQTYHGTPVPASPPSTTAPTSPKKSEPYQSCVIVQPASDQNLFAPESVPVSVQIAPALQDGDQITVQVDGLPLTSADGQTFQITQPERGGHSISAQVRNADGALLCNAPPVTFSVQRPSVNSPQSPVKPH